MVADDEVGADVATAVTASAATSASTATVVRRAIRVLGCICSFLPELM
jgi:hypothetical protein